MPSKQVSEGDLLQDPNLGFTLHLERHQQALPIALSQDQPAAVAFTNVDFLTYSSSSQRHSAEEMHEKLASIKQRMVERGEDLHLDAPLVKIDVDDQNPGEVDKTMCEKIIKLNSNVRNKTPSMADCYSCLSPAQHLHYKAIFDNYWRSGRHPNASEEYPHISTAVDLVGQERQQYLKRLQDTVVAAGTKNETENANYLPEAVETFAKGLMDARLQRAEQFLSNARNEATPSGRGGLLLDLESSQSSGNGARKGVHRRGVVAAPVGDGLLAGTDRASWEVKELLTTQADDEKGLKLKKLSKCPSHVGSLFKEPVETQLHAAAKESNLPVIVVSKSALLGLAWQHTRSYAKEATLPVKIIDDVDGESPIVVVGKAFGVSNTAASRKAAITAAIKRLVDSNKSLPTNQLGSKKEVTFTMTVQGGTQQVLLPVKCWFKTGSAGAPPTPVMRHIKVEYTSSAAGTTATCDAAGSVKHEVFSSEELAKLWILFHVIPLLTVVVYRVDAFTQKVTKVEHLNKRSFTASLVGKQQQELQGPLWDNLEASIGALSQFVTVSSGTLKGLHVLHRPSGSTRLSLNTVQELEEEHTTKRKRRDSMMETDVDANHFDVFAFSSSIEEGSTAAANREYLNPAEWTVSGRTSFTFPSAEAVKAHKKQLKK